MVTIMQMVADETDLLGEVLVPKQRIVPGNSTL